jgi:hypothetical protein
MGSRQHTELHQFYQQSKCLNSNGSRVLRYLFRAHWDGESVSTSLELAATTSLQPANRRPPSELNQGLTQLCGLLEMTASPSQQARCPNRSTQVPKSRPIGKDHEPATSSNSSRAISVVDSAVMSSRCPRVARHQGVVRWLAELILKSELRFTPAANSTRGLSLQSSVRLSWLI